MLGFLGFFTNKWVLLGIAALTISAIVGGFWMYQRSIVTGLEKQVATKQQEVDTLKEQVAGLMIDNEMLRISNTSLSNELERRVNELQQVFAEMERINRLRDESAARIAEMESIIRDEERNERIAAIRESERASLLLRFQNLNIQCFIDNFSNPNGRCVQGRFIPNNP